MDNLSEYYSVIKNKISDGNFQSALNSIDKILKSYPHDANAHYYKGVCNFALERYSVAIKNYSIALNLNSVFAKAYFNIGICYYMIKYTDYALINIGKALFLFSKTKELDKKERCIEALKLIESEQNL